MLHLVLQRLRRRAGTWSRGLLSRSRARGLERQRELLGVDVAQQPLQRLGVERPILEDEHQVLDLIGVSWYRATPSSSAFSSDGDVS